MGKRKQLTHQLFSYQLSAIRNFKLSFSFKLSEPLNS